MRILLTRPQAESDSLAVILRSLGDEVTVEPMLEIADTGETPAFEGVQAVLVTSGNGVRALASRSPRRDIPVFAVGDATAVVARDAGFNRVESAQGASDALAKLVTEQLRPADGALLHVRGRDSTGDLAGKLETGGFEVRTSVLYEAQAAVALSPPVRDRLADGEIDAILFFSPRTARTFVKLAADAKIETACAAIDAICLSPAVAEAVASLAWRGVHVAASPDQAAMIEERNRMQADKDSDKAGKTAASATNDKSKTDTSQSDQPKSPSTLEKAVAKGGQDSNARDSKSAIPRSGGSKSGEGTKGGKPDDSKPSSATSASSESPQSRGTAFGLVGGLVVLLILAGAYIAWPLWGPGLPGWLHASVAPLMEAGRAASGAGNRIDALSGKITGLERDIAAVKAGVAAVPRIDPAQLTALDDAARKNAARIKAMEADLASVRQAATAAGRTDDVAALSRRLAETESRIAALAAEPGTKAAVEALDSLRTQSSARMTVLERENEALHKLIAAQENQMAAQENRMAALEKRPAAVAGTTRTNALVIAVGQLREAARGTAPFDGALSAVAALAVDDAALQPEIKVLAPLGKTGVPDLTALRLQFDGIARRVANEAYVPKGDGWVDKTLQQLSRMVTVKRSGADAAARDDENGRVVRAELRLAAGDLAGAVTALDGLGGKAAEIAAPWLKQAQLRLTVDAAIGKLFAEALQRIGGGRDAPRG